MSDILLKVMIFPFLAWVVIAAFVGLIAAR